MTAIDQIREVFHHIAGILVWPVLLGLIGLVAAMLVALGAFAREAWDRRRTTAAARSPAARPARTSTGQSP